jgi:8-oxo-dGTP pyrophosphatase MutT (NUDIX family)
MSDSENDSENDSKKRRDMPDLPDEPEQPWTTLASERPYVTPWLAIRRDQVRTHTGAEIAYSYMERPTCVAIVAVTATGEMLLLRQYRYPVRDWCWEIPMGGIEDGEDAQTSVARELAEEAGGHASSVHYIATFYTANGAVQQQCMVYLAQGVERQQPDHESTELIHVTTLPVAEALRMAHAGEITDGLSALSILLCEPYL